MVLSLFLSPSQIIVRFGISAAFLVIFLFVSYLSRYNFRSTIFDIALLDSLSTARSHTHVLSFSFSRSGISSELTSKTMSDDERQEESDDYESEGGEGDIGEGDDEDLAFHDYFVAKSKAKATISESPGSQIVWFCFDSSFDAGAGSLQAILKAIAASDAPSKKAFQEVNRLLRSSARGDRAMGADLVKTILRNDALLEVDLLMSGLGLPDVGTDFSAKFTKEIAAAKEATSGSAETKADISGDVKDAEQQATGLPKVLYEQSDSQSESDGESFEDAQAEREAALDNVDADAEERKAAKEALQRDRNEQRFQRELERRAEGRRDFVELRGALRGRLSVKPQGQGAVERLVHIANAHPVSAFLIGLVLILVLQVARIRVMALRVLRRRFASKWRMDFVVSLFGAPFS